MSSKWWFYIDIGLININSTNLRLIKHEVHVYFNIIYLCKYFFSFIQALKIYNYYYYGRQHLKLCTSLWIVQFDIF